MFSLPKPKKFQFGFNFFRENSRSRQRGFTLIELLIVVSIIVILITIGAVSYTTVNRNARDSQRKSDLKKIQLALEEFKANNGSYPAESPPTAPQEVDSISCTVNGTPNPPTTRFNPGQTFQCNGITYLQKMPTDPSTGYGYYYEIGDGMCEPVGPDSDFLHCQKYTLWAKLENTNDPAVTATTSDTFCQAYVYSSLTAYGANYCVHQ